MTSILDGKAYLIKTFFNLLGGLGSPLLNLGSTRNLELFTDLPYGTQTDQRLDILRPESTRPGALPVLVYFHGGGWISASKKICRGIAATLARNGLLTFNVDYRLAPKSRFPAPLQDATLAMDWIYRNAARYGGDPSAIVLAGDSAGAQIAAWYASALHNHGLFRKIGTQGPRGGISVKGLLLFYGVYDFDTVKDARFPFIKIFACSLLGSDPRSYEENAKLASPIGQISRDLPPVWLCVGKRDGLFAQSRAYARALEHHGVRCRTLFFPDHYRAPHGFLFFRWLKSSRTAVAAAREFLRDRADL
ncbi:MAG: alpha/beta hydrolase [Candidatus Thiosymbion ectosymbiont of Robbea hypermnestra]|nr:alpha/beta hydrolase [Candidatus Thiosymbion ectosymbiont of Robbea hypermnestra]